jgi:hypothetical protein
VIILIISGITGNRLDGYNVDKSAISVSGLSSGGYMTVQLHIAHSSMFMGAGIVAGGPFWCAQDDLEIALSSCMKDPSLISVDELVKITHNTALTDTIDPLTNLVDDKVYLFSGSKDTVIKPGVMEKLMEYYRHFVNSENIQAKFDIPSEHAMVTDDYGNDCSTLRSPYINNCNYSTPYNILKHIYGDHIRPAKNTQMIKDNLLEFSQREYFTTYMDKIGYVYVPRGCRCQLDPRMTTASSSTICSVHVVFHGCKQGREFVDTKFVINSGYNEIAEVNNIIILYPQIHTDMILNPKGCWDWWGYTGPDYGKLFTNIVYIM